ncbi:hypothetical protein KI387_018216, partial [Taxus chinensis]
NISDEQHSCRLMRSNNGNNKINGATPIEGRLIQSQTYGSTNSLFLESEKQTNAMSGDLRLNSMGLKFMLCLALSFFVCATRSRLGENRFDPQWQPLTRNNFSTQIRQHEFVLLMATVPWSGESRSLRNDLVQLMKYSGAQFESLRLMLIYKNVEKLLGDVVVGNKAVNLFFYRQGEPYKYSGKLSAQNILASVWHTMTIPSHDLPLKQLGTLEEVESFLQSTDKGVLLFDICGWAHKIAGSEKEKNIISTTKKGCVTKSNTEEILGRNNPGILSKESALVSRLKLESDDSIESIRVNDLQREKNTNTSPNSVPTMAKELGFVSEQEPCEIAKDSSSTLSKDGLYQAGYGIDSTGAERNKNLVSRGKGSNHSSNGYKDILFFGSSCTSEEYNYFEILYTNLSRIARDNMLPPERQKFGIISNSTAISALSLSVHDRPSIMLHFPDCPNCSETFDRKNDLEEFILRSHPLVTQLEGEGYKLIPPLSTENPSLILFIDRASSSAESRQRSYEALQALRQVAFRYAQSFQSGKSTKGDKILQKSYSSLQDNEKILPPSSSHLQMQALQSPELVKGLRLDKNNIFQVKTTDGELHIVNFKGDDNLFSDPAQKILDYLLQQEKSGIQLKQDRLSLLAKKAGFQLLSSDYVLDVNQLSQIPETFSSLTEKTSGIPEEDFKNLGRTKNVEAEELHKELGYKLDNVQRTHLVGTKHDATIADEEQVEGIGLDDTNLDPESSESVNYDHSETQGCFATAGKDECKSEISTVEALDGNNGEKGMPEKIDPVDQVLYLKDSTNKDSGDEEYSKKINVDNEKDTCPIIGNGEKNQECTSPHKGEQAFFERNDEELETLDETQGENCGDDISFFFAEGGDQLREILSSDATIPLVVLIDHVEKTHYVLPKEVSATYSSLFDFVKAFKLGTLKEYKRSEPFPPSPREPPRPPFVNRDFHEIDSTPRVTVATFSRLILGFEGCNDTVETSCASSHHPGVAWEKDVLVLFSNDWCGFCKRSQLIVREVHRFFKHCANFLHAEGEIAPNASSQDMLSLSTEMNREKLVGDLLKDETTKGDIFKDEPTNVLPSIFQIDCTLNDCSSLLKYWNQKELYPTLLLFPAGRKDEPIAYEGDISVNKIIEFLTAHGSVTGHLYGLRGVLWNKMQRGTSSNICTSRVSSSVPIQIQAPLQIGRPAQDLLSSTVDQYGSSQSHSGDGDKFSLQSEKPAIGSLLVSSEKLHGTYPFENSIIVIVNSEPNEGFEGLIVNKPLSWGDLPKIDIHIEPILKLAPINFGGPLIAKGMPFLSLTRLSNLEGFQEVLPGTYYGGPVATSKIFEMIKSGKVPADNFWFFLGFATWGWQQLFDELAAEAWNLSTYREGLIRWPAHTT